MPNRAALAALLAEGEDVFPNRHEAPVHLAGDKAERTDKGYRVERPQARAQNATDTDAPEATKIYIYSEIGGWWGVWPEEIIAELEEQTGDIELHLHSPGGDAFDGIAIYNAFKDYDESDDRGAVNVEIDGLAASAASVIAMAGRKVKMKRAAQIMIHDAWGYAVGPQEDMAKMTTFLGKISDSIAEIYAERAGGTAASWRDAMKAESWYRDKEAVEAGLADEITTKQDAAKAAWNLAGIFNYAGRDAAPKPAMPGGHHPVAGAYDSSTLIDMDALRRLAEQDTDGKPSALAALQGAQALDAGQPVTPAQAAALMHAAAQRARARTQTPVAAVPADGPSHTEGADGMPTRKEVLEALGLGPDATDAQAQEVWAKTFAPPAAPAPTPQATPPADEPANTGDLSALAQLAAKMGVTLIDSSQLVRMQTMAEQGKTAYDERRREQRDQVIDSAIQTGRIELSRKEHWQKKWDGDPEGTRLLIESLAPNMVPMDAVGYAGTVAANEAEQRYYDLYPEARPQGGGHRG
jgi:ATP-dependent protease ClpP protease subunit